MSRVEVFLGNDNIYTDFSGFKQLLNFYDECKKYSNCKIKINLGNLNWLDGNLCAFLGALLYRLKKDNSLSFIMDTEQIIKKCDILFHNDFLPVEQNHALYKKKSCIPFRGLYPKQKDEFIDYLENDLLSHSSMPKFRDATKEKLIDDLVEVYGNIDKHAETIDPFFVCGQYFPSKEAVNFTISDIGVGFFKKINECVPQKVKTCGDAILWAVEGNSTKPDASGGTGLKNLHKYLDLTRGGLQIYTGDAGWCSKTIGTVMFPNGIRTLDSNYIGATINLQFNKKMLT